MSTNYNRVRQSQSSFKRMILVIFASMLYSIPLFAEAKPQQPEWNKFMQKLQVSLESILNQPKDISKELKSISEVSKQLVQESEKASGHDLDPSISMIARLFARDAQILYKQSLQKHTPVKQESINALASYCIACHTRSTGKNFIGNTFSFENLSKLDDLTKIQILAASRNFDEAFNLSLQSIGKKSNNTFAAEKIARIALAIAVRVQNNPSNAQKVIDEIQKAQDIPFYFKEQAKLWENSIAIWKKENKRVTQTEEGLFAEVNRLMAMAKSVQKYPADRSADIVFLRATATLHQLLSKYPKGKHTSEAFLMAGSSYEVMREFDLGELHELYYANCIFSSPHTDVAKQCYGFYERSIYFGYTGSSGENIPEDVMKTLSDLEKMANPEKNPSGTGSSIKPL